MSYHRNIFLVSSLLLIAPLLIATGAYLVLVFPPFAVRLGTLSPEDAHRRSEIKRLAAIDISAEVDAAIDRNDHRLVGVYQELFFCPGADSPVSRYKDYELQDILGTREMLDTSDAIESQTHRDYNEAAYDYALAYNTRLIDELDRLGKLPRPESHETR